MWIKRKFVIGTKHTRISKSVIEMVNISISADRKLSKKRAQDSWVCPLQFYEFLATVYGAWNDEMISDRIWYENSRMDLCRHYTVGKKWRNLRHDFGHH